MLIGINVRLSATINYNLSPGEHRFLSLDNFQKVDKKHLFFIPKYKYLS
jgi:hypothetical protein